ncbi:MAG: hypothetical protein N3I86_03050 [Verrucomicrobiae bacterium]|nr:hypothetical protein [Verrucomicrobiae bacterium]MDW8308545.1 hypothetical protein [Verrucomicrobiales bacterium]
MTPESSASESVAGSHSDFAPDPVEAAQPARLETWRWCPRCGHELQNHKCKFVCPRCHYFMSCSDFD